MAQVTGKSGILNKLASQAHEVASQAPHEGQMTRRIEQQTAKIPSVGFLGLAVGSMVASAALAFFAQRKELATFVGLWAPSLLLIGVYNKLVKLEAEGGFGQQRFSRRGQNVSGQDYSQSYGTSQGFSGQGASEQGIAGQGYTGI